ncbi:hypothetical protein Tcan_03166 [Toxocara canis]|uniref:Uncharacterized protein n=1 Tax=Toxocara canis TaxID=6265 RepID=A0A0B2VDP4_TOXCA|nr:hypothetical protein Tcan_03166 [Toxocara canis]
MEKRNNNATSPAAPHRGFNDKAREVLLDRKKSQQKPGQRSNANKNKANTGTNGKDFPNRHRFLSCWLRKFFISSTS